MVIDSSFIDSLFPVAQRRPGFPASRPNALDSLIEDLRRIQDQWLQLKAGRLTLYGSAGEIPTRVDYTPYLQMRSGQLRALARSIVSPGQTDDQKALALLNWVRENIDYADDRITYGQDEYWAFPSQTLKRGAGDCEDGAFLLAGLMLQANVDPDRIRVYGGFVSAGTAASTGGHAWVAYKRETDDKWVALDWCYYPTDEPVAGRTPLREDFKYQDDFFYVTATDTVETPYVNTLRLPDGYRRALSRGPGRVFEARA